jgi:hypothetical protein
VYRNRGTADIDRLRDTAEDGGRNAAAAGDTAAPATGDGEKTEAAA